MGCMERLKFLIAKGARHLFALLLVAGLSVAAEAAGVVYSTYAVTTNWTAPEGVFSVTAEVWGGGGGGGGNSTQGGSGGGGGGYARKHSLAVTPGVNYPVNVGNGGSGGPVSTPGTSGGESYFIAAPTVGASGGGGGGGGGAGPGTQGMGTAGDVLLNGGAGAMGASAYGGGAGGSAGSDSSGNPGSSMSGGNAVYRGGAGGPGSNVSVGSPGGDPGGGAGGGFKNYAGAQGRPGQVVVSYTLPVPGTPAPADASQESIAVTWSTTNTLNGYRLEASTASNFTGTLFSSQTAQVLLSTLSVSGLLSNTTYYLRVGTLWNYATYYASAISTSTAIETPSSVYFDEVSTRSITASAYATSFSNLGAGLSGVNLTTGAAYGDWTSGGDNWALKVNMLIPRHGAAAAALGGKIYVMGGTSDGINYLNNNAEYDPVANTWNTNKAVLNTGRYLLAAAAAGGKIYALGGYNNLAGGVLAVNEEYDPAADAWRNAAPLPTPRERLAAVAAGGKIYALGGFNSLDYALNEIYDPASNTWITGVSMPTARKSLAAAYLNGKIYAVGGNGGGYKNVNEEYDLNSKTWSTKAAMPTARSGLAAAAIGGKLYAASGFDGTYISKNEAYDPNSNAWAAKNPIPVPREGMAYAAAGGKLYAFGGNDGTYLSSTTAYFPGVSKVFGSLQPNTQYSLMVKARNQAGVETGDMGTFNAYTLAVATVPASGPAVQVLSAHDAQVFWSSGSQAGGYNGPNASYRVEASTTPDFSGELRFQTPWDFTQSYFGGLEPKTTYYFRVQAYNGNNITDYSWVVLGSTRMPAEPLGGTAVSTMAWNGQNYNWPRAMVRDSDGNLYLAYLKYYYGKFRVFLSRSADNGSTWADTTAAPIETAGDVPSANSYDQYWPALAIDSQDVLHLVWGGTNNQLDPSGGVEPKCAYSSAPAPGNNWNFHTKIPAHTYQGNEFTFNIAVDSNDGLHVVWAGEDAGGAGTASIRYSSRAADGNWTPYVLLNDDALQADFPALAIDDKDGLHLVAKRATAGGTNTTPVISYSSRPPAGSWGSWTEIYTGVGGYHQSPPSLTIMADGTRFAAWSSADGTYSNSQVKYSAAPPGAAWAPMAYVDTAIPEAPQANPSAAADAIGNVYVIWAGSDTKNPVINLKGSAYNGSAWDNIEGLTDEDSLSQIYPAVRWAGWRNNGGGIDVIWNTWDGISSTATLRVMQGPDVPMSPGWSKTAWPVPAGCGYALNVKQDGAGDFTGIGQALNAVPQELSTTTCVVLRDDGTYGEQVTVEGIQTGRWDNNTSYRLLIMKDPTFISSSPVVSPPASSTAAFHILNDSVSVTGIDITAASAVSYGILASSANINISSVSVISGGLIGGAGIKISSYSRVDYSTINVQDAYGLWLQGIHGGASDSYISNSASGKYALYLDAVSSAAVSGSYLLNSAGTAISMRSGAAYNEISRSTAVTGGSAHRALELDGASTNTVRDCYFSAPLTVGVMLAGGFGNTIERSTITINNGGYPALSLWGSHSNTISACNIYSQAGFAVHSEGSSSLNTISLTRIAANSASGHALKFDGGSSNTVVGSYLSNTGNSIGFITGSQFNYISQSTVTSSLAGKYGVYFDASGWNNVIDSYVQGSTAVYTASSNPLIVRGSELQATDGVGLSLLGVQGVFVTTSVISGGSGNAAVYVGPGNTDKVELDSNTIAGGAYGLSLSALSVGGSLEIRDIAFQTLSPGATAINFLSGVHNADIEGADFSSPDIDVNVNGSQLLATSNIFLGHPEGKWGALYENDPFSYVNWPGMTGFLTEPGDGALDVSPAAALRAMVDGGNISAQFNYQVDYADTMDSQGIVPLYDFDQTGAQAFLNQGAFSGQDWTIAVASDAYVYDSTATFVFYSTGTRLNQNTLYHWRVRVKTPESGAYGQWTATASFITGYLAEAAPVNNLAVTGVTLSSPSAAGVEVGFTLRENNVSTGTTPNGANYNTADWIFVKFSTQAGADGTWNHATLTGGAVGAGATLAAASDNKGVFINHTQNAAYWTAGATVTWNYGADGVTGGDAMVKVFAISMVKVPTGQFVYNAGGIGGIVFNNYGGGSQITVSDSAQRPAGTPAGWPNGYNSFYIMRYELTQGQYADFLNTVHSSTAAALYATDSGSGHSMSNGGTYPSKYSAEDRFAAKNYLSPSDLWSFLSWAALRPMTEMEFEKAARDVGGDSRTYPWGNTAPGTSNYNPRNEGGTHTRDFMNFYPGVPSKVLDSGRYLSGDVYRTPEQTGASPYGIADLAGNVNEILLNCSYLSVPSSGDGTVAWPVSWPAPDSSEIGLRGGGFTGNSSTGRASERSGINLSWNARLAAYGGRGCRTP